VPHTDCTAVFVNFPTASVRVAPSNHAVQAAQSLNCGLAGVTVAANFPEADVIIEPMNCAFGAFTMFVLTGGNAVALAEPPNTIKAKHAMKVIKSPAGLVLSFLILLLLSNLPQRNRCGIGFYLTAQKVKLGFAT